MFHLGSYRKKEKQMDEKAMELLSVFGLESVADYRAANLPYGKQRKLEIARALATEPKLLLLDEPAAGMNPNETEELMETIEVVRKRFGVTVLLIEHDMKAGLGYLRISVCTQLRSSARGGYAEGSSEQSGSRQGLSGRIREEETSLWQCSKSRTSTFTTA